MTGPTLEKRFHNHKAGTKAGHYVRRYGKGFLPELHARLNPMPCEQVRIVEREPAEDPRRKGCMLTGAMGGVKTSVANDLIQSPMGAVIFAIARVDHAF